VRAPVGVAAGADARVDRSTTLSSSQTASFGSFTQRSSGSLHESVVHAKPSPQLGGVPAVQPVAALQPSGPLQKRPSSQTRGVPAHVPALQWSPTVHALPSLHGFVSSFVNVQPVVASQASSVQTLPSLQVRDAPPQTPLWQVSVLFGPVHALPSLHGDPFGFCASAGQLPAPSQLSAASHWPAAVRHTTVFDAKFGRHVPAPSQVSAPLQTVLVGSPQAVPLDLKPFAGQLPAPSHVSATSHWPLAERHTTVLAATLVRHVPVASHVSAPLQAVLVGSPQAVRWP
jgi:hypothetical protein